ncbi:unnamed protein product, partial [Heterobilharzia americana]
MQLTITFDVKSSDVKWNKNLVTSLVSYLVEHWVANFVVTGSNTVVTSNFHFTFNQHPVSLQVNLITTTSGSQNDDLIF